MPPKTRRGRGKQYENEEPSSASMEDGPKRKRQRKQPKKEEEKQTVGLSVFEHHIAAAKPIIINSFSPNMYESQVVRLWDSLANTNWQDDVDICTVALGSGLPVKKLIGSNILKNTKYMVNFLQSTKNLRQAKELWETIDEKTQCKKELAFAALKRGVPFSSLPKKVVENSALLKDGLEKGLFRWKKLPKKLRTEVEFALCALRSNDRPIFLRVNPEFSNVLQDVTNKEKLWVQWACKNPDEVELELWRQAPAKILSDPKLMLTVIAKDRRIIKYVASSLLKDLEFLTSALKNDPLVLGYLSAQTFRDCPSLLDLEWLQKYNAAVRLKCGTDGSRRIYELGLKLMDHNVPKKLWTDKEFVLQTWLKACSPLSPDFPERLLDDEEIVLTHAKYFYGLWGEQRFESGLDSHAGYARISQRLQCNKAFLKKLMNLASMDATMSLIAVSPLKQDDELQILACSKWNGYRPYNYDSLSLHRGPMTVAEFDELRRKREELCIKIHRQVRAYQGFFTGILCGMKTEASQLSILDQGPDANIKKTIASFLDFPLGGILPHLLRAARNLNVSPNENGGQEEEEESSDEE